MSVWQPENERFCLHCIGVEYLGTFCSVLFGFRTFNKVNYIACPLRIPGISVTSTPGTSFFHFWSINSINWCALRIFQCFSMALKPKDVRVPLPVQLILDCHWLVCVWGEGLTDRSIVWRNSSLCPKACLLFCNTLKNTYIL